MAHLSWLGSILRVAGTEFLWDVGIYTEGGFNWPSLGNQCWRWLELTNFERSVLRVSGVDLVRDVSTAHGLEVWVLRVAWVDPLWEISTEGGWSWPTWFRGHCPVLSSQGPCHFSCPPFYILISSWGLKKVKIWQNTKINK